MLRKAAMMIGCRLVSMIGRGELFEPYSRSFDMENFWALTIILFAAAMLMSAAAEHVEKKVDYYAGVR
jgi:NitT/TauT family transport system permease protein